MAKISRKLGFYNMEIVKAERNSRGLALLWSDEANFTCNWKSSFGRCLPTLSQQETCQWDELGWETSAAPCVRLKLNKLHIFKHYHLIRALFNWKIPLQKPLLRMVFLLVLMSVIYLSSQLLLPLFWKVTSCDAFCKPSGCFSPVGFNSMLVSPKRRRR